MNNMGLTDQFAAAIKDIYKERGLDVELTLPVEREESIRFNIGIKATGETSADVEDVLTVEDFEEVMAEASKRIGAIPDYTAVRDVINLDEDEKEWL